MKKSKSIFNFQNTYRELSEKFYREVQPFPSPNPAILLFNDELVQTLELNLEADEDLLKILAGNELAIGSQPIAQAYAGHQFGHFTMLGDGRAILLGEHIFGEHRVDIQLKGSGQTPYSRRGDGKASIKPMLREYLISEAMFHLHIPTSRSLAVVKTGEQVFRQSSEEGAILTRVMSSHLRVGTFEFARYYAGNAEVEELVNYTINRHFPEVKKVENKSIALLDKVMELQIDLVVNWMRVGFIHGVMNTDNTSIAGETFDYGPCAFLGVYNPDTVFSSIDRDGRYAFGNQPTIIKWNLARLAETLLPLFDEDEEKSILIATEKINEFDQNFSQKWYEMLFGKIGIQNPKEGDDTLIDELLQLMLLHKKDYTNTFTYLRIPELFDHNKFTLGKEFDEWISKWSKRISESEGGREVAFEWMKKNNPVYIPRNFYVEEALDYAADSNLLKLNRLLEVLKYPYEFRIEMDEYLYNPADFDTSFLTFCGT